MIPDRGSAATQDQDRPRQQRTPEQIVRRLQARIVKAQEHRVPNGALERHEPCTRKRVRTVLGGGGGGNAASLLGTVGVTGPGYGMSDEVRGDDAVG